MISLLLLQPRFFLSCASISPSPYSSMNTKTRFPSEKGNYVVSNGVKKRVLTFESDKNYYNLFRSSDKSQTLGILAFETAKIMSRLVSLHKSLNDDELTKLRNEILKLKGVSYLVSKDDDYLLKLACMEKIEDLDRSAVVVARLGKNCSSNPDLMNFSKCYSDMKLGLIDLDHFSDIKIREKTIGKVEKFITSTSELYTGIEMLSQMELSEQKIKQWKNNIPTPGPKGKDISQKMNFDLLESKISWQKQQIKHLKQVSLWGQTFNKTVRLMARTIFVVYARLCIVFSPYIPKPSRHTRIASQPDLLSTRSKRPEKEGRHSISGSIPITNDEASDPMATRNSALMQEAGPSTAGGLGLTLRYANVVLIAETYFMSRSLMEDGGREHLYQILPGSIRRMVVSKLKKLQTIKVEGRGDDSMALGWREGVNEIMEWLAPMAHDTIRWLMERNVERQNFDPKPKVLLMQTLFFADREKAEAAIAEVLVGLSCICKYESLRYF